MNPDNPDERESSMQMAVPDNEEEVSAANTATEAPGVSSTQLASSETEHSSVAIAPPAIAEDMVAKKAANSSAPPGSTEGQLKEHDGAGDDFDKISVDEALRRLECTKAGLTDADVQSRLQKFGPNKIPEDKKNPYWEYAKFFWNPLSWCMEVAAILAIILLDYVDFILIILLLFINATIGYYEESSADNAIAALTASLAPKAKALRNGSYQTVDAGELVPGDVILCRLGDVLPADVKILGDEHDEPMLIDQAALTGESLPVKRFTGQCAFSGSAVKQGERPCLVYATGANTFFGKAASLIGATDSAGHLQTVLTIIGATCICTIVVWVIIELAVQFGYYGHQCSLGEGMCPTLENMLVIIVGGIPIAMPTVLSVTLALGAFKLAQKGAIVSRLTAIEEMAGMDMLCSDKTGTLTLNQLSVDKANLCAQEPDFVADDILLYGALGARIENEEPIDMCCHEAYDGRDTLWDEYELLKYTPFNPNDKRTVALVKNKETGKIMRCAKGAPQIVLGMAHNVADIKERFDSKILEFASRGYRALGVAVADGDTENKWNFVGLIPIFDPPRHDTKATVEKCIALGIGVKMITGDQLPIAIETARQLGMGTNIHTTEIFKQAESNGLVMGTVPLDELVEAADGMAEVFPEHKYDIVARLQKMGHMTGMTGDGVNDAPALKKADIGIAVADATDAARAAADIVLTEPGLGVIIDAIIGARKIFQRMKNYAKYTIAMTFRICFTFGLLTVIYNWYFPTILIVLLAIFNDGAMISLSKDRVEESPLPEAWFLKNIFIAGFVYGMYLTLSSWVLFYVASHTDFFSGGSAIHLVSLQYNNAEADCMSMYGFAAGSADLNQCQAELFWSRQSMLRALMYSQVSISGMGLIFVTRTHGFSFLDRPGTLLLVAFMFSQLVSSIISGFGLNGYQSPPSSQSVDAQWAEQWDGLFSGQAPLYGTEAIYTPSVIGCGWWVIVSWVWVLIWYIPLDFIKFLLMWGLEGQGPSVWFLPRFIHKPLVPNTRASAAASRLGGSRATVSSGRPRSSRVVRGSVY